MRCAKHDEETAVSCGRCSAPVCPRCMVHSDVGVRCKNCAGDRVGRPVGNRSRVVLLGALALGAIIAVGSVGSGVFGGSSDDPADLAGYPAGYGNDPATTIQQVVDPWISEGGRKPRDGYRFVAVELIEDNHSGSEPAWVYMEDYSLIDADDFVYGPLFSDGAEPRLPNVTLNPGQKSRGWLTFEVPQGNDVVALNDYVNNIPLPE